MDETRRTALLAGGVAAFASLLGVAALPSAARAAGPAAGQYVVVRIRKLKSGVSADDIMKTIDEGYIPLIRTIPGFVSYTGTSDDSGTGVFIGTFSEKAGADESTRRAGEWLTANGHDFFEGDPTVIEGVITVAADA